MTEAFIGKTIVDSTYGLNGYKQIDIGWYDYLIDVAESGDGATFVLAEVYADSTFNIDFALLCLDQKGNPDSSFSDDGIIRADFAGFDMSSPREMRIDDQNRILILGSAYNEQDPLNRFFALNRFLPDGSLDSNFGTAGQFAFHFITIEDDPYALELMDDGRIVVAGTSFDSSAVHQEFAAIARLLPDGTLDSSFGGTGKIVIDYNQGVNPVSNFQSLDAGPRHVGGGSFFDVLVQDDGKIICAGSYYILLNYESAVLRLNEDASLDTSFLGQGYSILDLEPGYNNFYRRVVQHPSGKILLVPEINTTAVEHDMQVIVINRDGSFDPWIEFSMGGQDFIHDLILDDQGSLILVGGVIENSNYNIGYLSDYFVSTKMDLNGDVDTSFLDQGSLKLTSSYEKQFGATKVTVLTESAGILTGGFVQTTSTDNYSDLVLMRYVEVEEEVSTGIAFNNAGVFTFNYYPNPVVDKVIIESEFEGVLFVSDLDGKLLNQELVNKGKNEFDFTFLGSGMYLLTINSVEKQLVKRVVKY